MHNAPSFVLRFKLASFAARVKAPLNRCPLPWAYLLLFGCLVSTKLGWASEASQNALRLTFSSDEIEVSASGIRLVTPLSLKVSNWTMLVRRGRVEWTSRCGAKWTLDDISGYDGSTQWLTADSITACQSESRLQVSQLKFSKGPFSLFTSGALYSEREGLTARRVSAACGTYVPLAMRADSVRNHTNEWVLENVSVGIGGIPIAWFPSLKLRTPGTPGFLPPSFAVTRDRLAIGVPLYLPLQATQNLIIEPGYQYQPEQKGHYGFGRGHFQWLNDRHQIGNTTVVAQHNALALLGNGNGRFGALDLYTRGEAWWGHADALPAQTRTLKNRIGYGISRYGILWSRRQSGLTLDAVRVRTSLDRGQAFSLIGVGGKHTLNFSGLSTTLGHDTQLTIEPTQNWLGHTHVDIAYQDAWYLARMNAETRLSVQSLAGPQIRKTSSSTNQHVPIIFQSITTESDWVRPGADWSQELRLSLAIKGHHRHMNALSTLDPLTGFAQNNVRGVAEFGMGLLREDDVGRVSIRQYATALSPGLPKTFTEFRGILSFSKGYLEGSYIDKRQSLVAGQITIVPEMVIHASFVQQNAPVLLNRLWASGTSDARPTIQNGITWQTREHRLNTSLWFVDKTTRFAAASLSWSMTPTCECLRVISDLQYDQRNQSLLAALQLTFDLDSRYAMH